MALKNYHHVSVANTTHTLCTSSAGHEIAIVGIVAACGAEAGSCTLTVNDGSNDVFTTTFIFESAYDTVFFDSKIFLPANYLLKVNAEKSGVNIMVSADDSEV